MQRRLAVLVLLVEVGAARNEERPRHHVVGRRESLHKVVQRRVAIEIARIDVDHMTAQQRRQYRLVARRREMQRRIAGAVARHQHVPIGASNNRRNELEILRDNLMIFCFILETED